MASLIPDQLMENEIWMIMKTPEMKEIKYSHGLWQKSKQWDFSEGLPRCLPPPAVPCRLRGERGPAGRAPAVPRPWEMQRALEVPKSHP